MDGEQHGDTIVDCERSEFAVHSGMAGEEVLQALQAKAESRYEDCRALLWRVWEQNQSVQLGLLLVEVLCLHLARYHDARQVLARCAVMSEAELQLSTWHAIVEFSSGHYDSAESWCRRALSASSGASAEQCWTAVFYLFYTLCRRDKSAEADIVYREWEAKPFPSDTALVGVVKRQLKALILRHEGKPQEAAELLLQAAQQCPANSIYAAINHMTLGVVYHTDLKQRKEAEAQYLSSERIFAEHFPFSLTRAKNLSNIAVLCAALGRAEEAERARLAAYDLLHERYADTADFASCAVQTALWFQDSGRVEEAIKKRQELHEAYVQHRPHQLEAPINLCHLAELYEQANRQFEAESNRLQAESLFAEHHPAAAQRADNLMNLGILYYKLNRRDAAEQQHELAHRIYSQHFPTSADTAVNLLNWGVVYHNTGRLPQAESKYLEAHEIYARHHPNVDNAALNAFNLGLLYEMLGRMQEALKFVALAVEIWTQNKSEEARSRGLPALSRLKQAKE